MLKVTTETGATAYVNPDKVCMYKQGKKFTEIEKVNGKTATVQESAYDLAVLHKTIIEEKAKVEALGPAPETEPEKPDGLVITVEGPAKPVPKKNPEPAQSGAAKSSPAGDKGKAKE